MTGYLLAKTDTKTKDLKHSELFDKNIVKKVKMVSVQTIATIVVKTFKIVSEFALYFFVKFEQKVWRIGQWSNDTPRRRDCDTELNYHN